MTLPFDSRASDGSHSLEVDRSQQDTASLDAALALTEIQRDAPPSLEGGARPLPARWRISEEELAAAQ